MAVADEIERIQNAKTSIKTKLNALNDNEHQITDETIDEYPPFFDTIPTGGAESQEEYDYQLSVAKDILPDPVPPPELPYTELEYVQTTGTQFVDLNYLTKSDTGFEIDVNVSTDTGNNLFGATNDVNTRYPFFNLRGSGSPETVNRIYRYSYDNGSNNKMIDFQTSVDNQRHKFKVIRNDIYSYYTDDVLLGTVTMEHPLNARWVLFSFRDYSGGTIRTSLSETCKCKFYNMKIYEGTNIVMNLIPVKRKIDNKICLYDTVANNFLLNIGSGEFIAGGEI